MSYFIRVLHGVIKNSLKNPKVTFGTVKVRFWRKNEVWNVFEGFKREFKKLQKNKKTSLLKKESKKLSGIHFLKKLFPWCPWHVYCFSHGEISFEVEVVFFRCSKVLYEDLLFFFTWESKHHGKKKSNSCSIVRLLVWEKKYKSYCDGVQGA